MPGSTRIKRSILLLLLKVVVLCGGIFGAANAGGIEATLIAVDLSGYMINADYTPNRAQVQFECVNLLCTVKTQHPESTIGLMTMNCPKQDHPKVHITPTLNNEPMDVISKLSELSKKPKHYVQFEAAMHIGVLSLKRRKTNQNPRIIAFVGSPITEPEDPAQFFKWARSLRKLGIAVDIVSFGESPSCNTPILQKFIDSVNKDGNSHLVSLPIEECPSGGLSDSVFASPILSEFSSQLNTQSHPQTQSAASSSAAPAAPSFAEFGGVNPEVDPELASALKQSLEEEKQRREREAKRDRGALKKAAEAAQGTSPLGLRNASNHTDDIMQDVHEEEEEEDEDEELKRAFAASLADAPTAQRSQTGEEGGQHEDNDMVDEDDDDDDALIRKALEMSLRDSKKGDTQ